MAWNTDFNVQKHIENGFVSCHMRRERTKAIWISHVTKDSEVHLKFLKAFFPIFSEFVLFIFVLVYTKVHKHLWVPLWMFLYQKKACPDSTLLPFISSTFEKAWDIKLHLALLKRFRKQILFVEHYLRVAWPFPSTSLSTSGIMLSPNWCSSSDILLLRCQ